MNAPPKMEAPVSETGAVKQEEKNTSTTSKKLEPLDVERQHYSGRSPEPGSDEAAMTNKSLAVAMLTRAATEAEAMTPGVFKKARAGFGIPIVYALHNMGTDTGRLVAVDRDYQVIGAGKEFVPYDAQKPAVRTAPVYIEDTLTVRVFATGIVENGWLGTGPIFYLLADDDTPDTYAARLRALAACIAGSGS